MPDRKILVTATAWSPERNSILNGAFEAARKKYGDEMLVIVGYTAPSIQIANIATEHGYTVNMFIPDIDMVQGKHIDAVNGITVTSTPKSKYIRQIVEYSDAVMAFDRGDPVVMAAKRLEKQVWFP